jgi:triosephosphate isomerase
MKVIQPATNDLDRQLTQRLVDVRAEILTRVTIAYEPVWAIGSSGHQATPQQAQEAHGLIRRRFARTYGEKSAQKLAIQYGGSVKPENAAAMLSPHGEDGALIGGTSLHADQFLVIVRAGITEAQVKR